MSNKNELSYINALNKCIEMSSLNPKYIISDFERALINATNVSFPESISFGCIFHLGQSIWARIGNLGLISRYKNDLNFKKIVKMMLCLSFVPVQDVLIGYRHIKSLIFNYNIPEILEFLSYFEKIYVGNFNEMTGEYTHPAYQISFWNVHERVLLGLPRTSNNAESWNRTLNLRTVVANPNIAQFITNLLQQEELDIFNIKRAKIGIFQTNKNFKKEENIRICVKNYRFFGIITFLNVISKHYNFDFEEEEEINFSD